MIFSCSNLSVNGATHACQSKALQFLGSKLQYLRHLRQWLSCIWAPSTSRTKV